MTPRILRRSIERLALASLPIFGGAACGTAMPPPPSPQDMAVASALDDLACPVNGSGCYWLAYVDGGQPNDKISYWLGLDGGVDPCLPCAFETIPGVFCGGCEIIRNSCGTAYFCSIENCSNSCTGAGRRPAGLVEAPGVAVADLGGMLARMAHLEAASVPAFIQLALELQAHNAPERLIAGARRARLDEERHARVMGDFARGAGARALVVDVAPTPVRPLFELALENAVEGCVRETAGAVIAEQQSRVVEDPLLARALASIAVDERRHANLAWAVDAWVTPRLTREELRRKEEARAEAIRELLVAA